MSGWTYGKGDPRNTYFLSGILSCFLSLLVLITYCLFPRLQGKLFMKLITLISLCDFIANLSVIGGVPSDHDLCALQGIIQQFFYPASWIWTVIMTYLLYSLVIYGKISMAEWQMHAISWGIPLVCTVLPLTTSTYGVQANDDDWCWLQPRSLSNRSQQLSDFWEYLTFDCIIFGSFFLMTLWGILIFHRLRIQQIPATKTIRSTLRALLAYPIILFITWFPNAIVLISGVETAAGSPRMIVINSLSIWQGGFTAITFFINSQESRAHWIYLFKMLFGCCRSKGSNSTRDSVSDGSGGLSGFLSKLRVVDSRSSTADTIIEDFESDDAYYGRDNSMTEEGSRESSIALNQFNNPIYRPR